MNIIRNFELVLSLFIPSVIGYIVYSRGIISKSFIKDVTWLVFNITLPSTILSSMKTEGALRDAGELLISIPVGAAVLLFSWAVGIVLARLIEPDRKRRYIIQASVIFSNFTYLAYPFIEELYGKQAVFSASLFNVITFALMFTLGIYLMKKASLKNQDTSISIKSIITPPFAAVVIGMITAFTGLKLPFFVTAAVDLIGGATVPMAMTILGMILATQNIVKAFLNYKMWLISFARLIAIPLAVYYATVLFKLQPDIVHSAVALSAMPVAVNIVLLAQAFDGDSVYAADVILTSSILSVITLPLISMLAV